MNATHDDQDLERRLRESLHTVAGSLTEDVDTVRITAGDDTTDLRVYEVDVAGFAPFEIPADLEEYTSELLIDGRVVIGSTEEQIVPRR